MSKIMLSLLVSTFLIAPASAQTMLNYVPFNKAGDAITGVAFASLPGSPVAGDVFYLTDGLAANCADSSCTTWGTNVTGGTGSLKLLIWYNGSHWTLIGK